jgi:hypothetical protein
MERETGFEPATNSLEGCDSTPELLPLGVARQTWWRREDSNLRRAKPGRFTVCCHCPLGHTSKELVLAGSGWSRHPDLNRGPTVYKTVALPLSYAGGPGEFSLSAAWYASRRGAREQGTSGTAGTPESRPLVSLMSLGSLRPSQPTPSAAARRHKERPPPPWRCSASPPGPPWGDRSCGRRSAGCGLAGPSPRRPGRAPPVP